MIRISVVDKKMKEKIEALAAKQIPFAVSQGLSNAVQKTRDGELKREYQRVFEKRNEQFFKLTHSVARASISYTKNYGVAIAGVKRADSPKIAGTVGGSTKRKFDSSFMEAHVTGGIRRALRTKKAVPITKGKSPIYPITRSPNTGKVSNARKAKTLYNQDRTFMVGSKSGKSVLMVKTGKRTVKAAYAFVDAVENKKKYNPMPVIMRGVKSRLKTEFKASFVEGLRTARLTV